MKKTTETEPPSAQSFKGASQILKHNTLSLPFPCLRQVQKVHESSLFQYGFNPFTPSPINPSGISKSQQENISFSLIEPQKFHPWKLPWNRIAFSQNSFIISPGFLYHLIRWDTGRLKNEAFTSNSIVSSKQQLNGLKITKSQLLYFSVHLSAATNSMHLQFTHPVYTQFFEDIVNVLRWLAIFAQELDIVDVWLVTCSGIFENISPNVWQHSAECLATFPVMFSNIPGNVWGHSQECLATFPGMFGDIARNV